MSLCPYGAVKVEATGPPEIQAEACRGCGICVAACPALAINMSRYTEPELLAQIKAALS